MVKKVVKTIGATEFKRNCARLLDEVYETGLEIVVTRHGVPLARVLPTRERARELRALGAL